MAWFYKVLSRRAHSFELFGIESAGVAVMRTTFLGRDPLEAWIAGHWQEVKR